MKRDGKYETVSYETRRGRPGSDLAAAVKAANEEVVGKAKAGALAITAPLHMAPEEWRVIEPGLPLSARLAVVRCDLDGTGECGSHLAELWATSRGVFFRALLEYAHDARPDNGPEDTVLMVHPTLPGRVTEQPRHAFEKVWRDRGWREAPPDTEPPDPGFRPQYGIAVHDLVDYQPDSHDHPTLMVRCPEHPEGANELELDRDRVRRAARGIRTGQLVDAPKVSGDNVMASLLARREPTTS